MCWDKTCIVEVFFLVSCEFLVHTGGCFSLETGLQTGSGDLFSIWRRKEEEGKRPWDRIKIESASASSKCWLGEKRIYSCLALSSSTHHVSLQLLTSLLHSITHSLLCVYVPLCLSKCLPFFVFDVPCCLKVTVVCVTAAFYLLHGCAIQ